MARNQSPQHDSQLYSTLEVGSPTYSTLELDPKIHHFSTSAEVRKTEQNAAPNYAYHTNELSAQSDPFPNVEAQEKAAKGKMILGVPVRWFLILVAVVLVSVTGGVAGGVLGSKSSSNASKGEVLRDQNSPGSIAIITTAPATTSLDSATTSTASSSTFSTLRSSTATEPSAAIETLFEVGKYYNILNDFVFSNGKNSALRSNLTDAVWNNALALEEPSVGSTRQQWIFEPVPSSWPNASTLNPNDKTELVPAYWICNVEFDNQRLYVKAETERIELGVELALLFGPEDNADEQQYWYITRKVDNPLYYELTNWKSGNLWALTAHKDWWTPQMATFERADQGSRQWLILESDLK